MNTVGISFIGLIFLAAIAIGSAQLLRGKPVSGLLLNSFGVMGLFTVRQMQMH
jgi:hypothetical protein